jgi:hypothetical protein
MAVTIIPKSLADGQAIAAEKLLYQVPNGKYVDVRWLSVCNHDTAARTFSITLQLHQPQGNEGNKQYVRYNTSINVGDTHVIFETGIQLNDGDKIWITGDKVSVLDYVLTGFEYSIT